MQLYISIVFFEKIILQPKKKRKYHEKNENLKIMETCKSRKLNITEIRTLKNTLRELKLRIYGSSTLKFEIYRNSEILENEIKITQPKQKWKIFTWGNAILKYIRKIAWHPGDFPDGSCQSTGMFQDASRRS